MSEICETLMLICFGFSWPINAYKSYKARTAKGTSIWFMLLIISGYVAGIISKIASGSYSYVLVAYILNLLIVFANLAAYFRNKALDKRRESKLYGTEKIAA